MGNREVDAQVAERVLGWRWYTIVGISKLFSPQYANNWLEGHPVLYKPGKHGEVDLEGHRISTTHEKLPHYTTDVLADYEVLVGIKEIWHRNPKLHVFLNRLEGIWQERYPKSSVIDGVLRYEPGDYAKAALSVLPPTEATE